MTTTASLLNWNSHDPRAGEALYYPWYTRFFGDGAADMRGKSVCRLLHSASGKRGKIRCDGFSCGERWTLKKLPRVARLPRLHGVTSSSVAERFIAARCAIRNPPSQLQSLSRLSQKLETERMLVYRSSNICHGVEMEAFHEQLCNCSI